MWSSALRDFFHPRSSQKRKHIELEPPGHSRKYDTLYVFVRQRYDSHLLHDKYVWEEPKDGRGWSLLRILLVEVFMRCEGCASSGEKTKKPHRHVDPPKSIQDVRMHFLMKAQELKLRQQQSGDSHINKELENVYSSYNELHARAGHYVKDLIYRGYIQRADVLHAVEKKTDLSSPLVALIDEYNYESAVERCICAAREDTSVPDDPVVVRVLPPTRVAGTCRYFSRGELTVLQQEVRKLQRWDGLLIIKDGYPLPERKSPEVLILETTNALDLDRMNPNYHNVQMAILNCPNRDKFQERPFRVWSMFPNLRYAELHMYYPRTGGNEYSVVVYEAMKLLPDAPMPAAFVELDHDRNVVWTERWG